MSFDVQVKNYGDIYEISLLGRIEVASHDQLSRLFYDAIEGNCRGIVLELSGLAFISSNGIGAIMEAYTFIANRGGKLVLAGLNEKIGQIFKLIGILESMECFETSADAVASLSKDLSLINK